MHEHSKQKKRLGLYVVFDRLPCPEGARFVEVEDEEGRSVDLAPHHTWRRRPDGLWELGPFQKVLPRAKSLQTGFARVDEVAKYLAVSRSHVHSLMKGGFIDYVRLGNARRIPWKSVYECVEKNRVKAFDQVNSFELENEIVELEEKAAVLDTQVYEGDKIIEELQKENTLLKQQVNTNSELGKYLTKEQVAVILKVSPMTISRYCKLGILKSIHLGPTKSSRVLFKVEDVKEFIESRVK